MMSEANFTVAPGSSPCPTKKARRQHGSARRRSLSLRDLDGGLDFDGDGGNERGYSIPHRGLKPCLRGLGLLCGHLGDELVVDGEDERGLGAGLAPLPQERDCLFDAVGPRPLNWRVEDLGIARLVGEKPPTAAQRPCFRVPARADFPMPATKSRVRAKEPLTVGRGLTLRQVDS